MKGEFDLITPLPWTLLTKDEIDALKKEVAERKKARAAPVAAPPTVATNANPARDTAGASPPKKVPPWENPEAVFEDAMDYMAIHCPPEGQNTYHKVFLPLITNAKLAGWSEDRVLDWVASTNRAGVNFVYDRLEPFDPGDREPIQAGRRPRCPNRQTI